MLQQLKPVLLEPVLHNKRRQDSKPVHCNQEEPCLVHLEKAHVQQQRPRAANFFLIKKNFESQEGLHTDTIKKLFL